MSIPAVCGQSRSLVSVAGDDCIFYARRGTVQIRCLRKSDDRRWIRGKLLHACEPSLAERLSELFIALPIGVDHELLRKFATTCAQLRNDIAHYGGLRSRTASASFLRDTSLKNEVVGYLYHMTLLSEIGLSDHAIKVWTGKNLEGMVYRHYLVAIGFIEPAGTR